MNKLSFETTQFLIKLIEEEMLCSNYRREEAKRESDKAWDERDQIKYNFALATFQDELTRYRKLIAARSELKNLYDEELKVKL